MSARSRSTSRFRITAELLGLLIGESMPVPLCGRATASPSQSSQRRAGEPLTPEFGTGGLATGLRTVVSRPSGADPPCALRNGPA